MSATVTGPHRSIPLADGRERFLAELFDTLWDTYRRRVAYVARYEEVIRSASATFFNDHIAFRTIACQEPLAGITSLARIFEALGYRAAGCYHFDDKQLGAIHYQHANPGFPKLFISELRTWELAEVPRVILRELVAGHRSPLPMETIALLHGTRGAATVDTGLLGRIVDWIQRLPWPAPEKSGVLALNKANQYAAWVAVHGYNVNHFTSLVNSHGVASLDDIEKTSQALARAGIPMKKEIEGAQGSKLRQTATEAVTIDVDVLEGGQPSTMPWTYAYFELAERGTVTDPETGRAARFEGFLGPQATQLFEMTRVGSS